MVERKRRYVPIQSAVKGCRCSTRDRDTNQTPSTEHAYDNLRSVRLDSRLFTVPQSLIARSLAFWNWVGRSNTQFSARQMEGVVNLHTPSAIYQDSAMLPHVHQLRELHDTASYFCRRRERRFRSRGVLPIRIRRSTGSCVDRRKNSSSSVKIYIDSPIRAASCSIGN